MLSSVSTSFYAVRLLDADLTWIPGPLFPIVGSHTYDVYSASLCYPVPPEKVMPAFVHEARIHGGKP